MDEAIGDQSALSVVRPLVVSTEPFVGECLSSVLVRACEANIFTKASHLLNLIGLTTQASEAVPFTRTAAAPAIAKLLGTTAKQIESRMHPAIEEDFGRSTVRWFGDSIERRHIEARVRRFAPRSLEEHKHIPAIWAIRLLDYCPITLECLASECPKCSRQLGWRACRSLVECEKCGASLLGAKSRILPSHVHEKARLGAALVSPIASVRQTALSSLPDPFKTWTPADALLGLLTLGEAQLALEQSSSSSSTTGAAAKIAAGIEFARDWPDSLSRFASKSTASSNTTSVRLGLGPLGKLFQSTAVKTPVRDLVRSTIWASLGSAVIPAKLFSGSIVNVVRRDGKLTTLEASKVLRLDTKRLRRLEGRSETFLARHNVRGGVALYDAAAIKRLRDVLDRSVRPNVGARQLGIPRYCVEAFISAGLVDVQTDGDSEILTGVRLITRESIVALRERCQKHSGEVQGGSTLREAMRRNGDPQDWVAVLEIILSGGIRHQVNGCDGASLSDALIVEGTDIARHFLGRSAGPGINGVTISCQTAAKMLGATPMFVSSAVKLGFMAGETPGRNYALPLEHVLKFQKRYVFGRELRETLGGHQKSISSDLRKTGLKPAATINHTTVWLRSDIKNIEKQSNTYRPVD